MGENSSVYHYAVHQIKLSLTTGKELSFALKGGNDREFVVDKKSREYVIETAKKHKFVTYRFPFDNVLSLRDITYFEPVAEVDGPDYLPIRKFLRDQMSGSASPKVYFGETNDHDTKWARLPVVEKAFDQWLQDQQLTSEHKISDLFSVMVGVNPKAKFWVDGGRYKKGMTVPSFSLNAFLGNSSKPDEGGDPDDVAGE